MIFTYGPSILITHFETISYIEPRTGGILFAIGLDANDIRRGIPVGSDHRLCGGGCYDSFRHKLTSGVYLYRLEVGAHIAVRKMVFAK